MEISPRMKEFHQIALVFGSIVFSSFASAESVDPIQPAQEQAGRLSSSRLEYLGFKFAELRPQPTDLAVSERSLAEGEFLGKTVTMPKFVVTARQVLPRESELLTDYGRMQVAKQRFTSPLYRATFGPLAQLATYYFNFLTILNGWHPSEAEAMTLYRESERVRILSDFDDLCRLEGIDDPPAGEEFRRMRYGVWRTGVDSLYGDPYAGPAGLHIGRRKR
jgi:hypothetical protein